MSTFHDLDAQEKQFTLLVHKFDSALQSRLLGAYDTAKRYHDGQLRDGGDVPYIIHPLRCAITLIRDVKVTDPDIIVATLFHDLLEDTDISEEMIVERFGQRVLDLTKALTRPRPEVETIEHKRESKKKKFLWYINDASKEACMIKSADLYDNMRSWRFVPAGDKLEQKFPRWCGEVYTYYLPVAKKADPACVTLFEDLIAEYKEDERFAPYLTPENDPYAGI